MDFEKHHKFYPIESLFENFYQLEDETILLRELKEEDAEDVLELYSEKDISLYDKSPYIADIEDAIRFINEINSCYYYRKRIDWAIVTKSSNKLVGLIAIHSLNSITHTAEVGYLINKKYRNKGIMTEALNIIIKFLFENVDLYSLNATIHIDNIPSIMLCKKVGFKVNEYLSCENKLFLTLINARYYV